MAIPMNKSANVHAFMKVHMSMHLLYLQKSVD